MTYGKSSPDSDWKLRKLPQIILGFITSIGLGILLATQGCSYWM